eukprot:TRINITY_DN419_c0_g3_i1.p1 TRINITY_DN419_c0_g3~~TRINITY_DN419_c0_g3_i1.p1  ORF type:complete len:223 (-),score=63.26 TRINITY_DN419_c0_g3_i1:292-960(-)
MGCCASREAAGGDANTEAKPAAAAGAAAGGAAKAAAATNPQAAALAARKAKLSLSQQATMNKFNTMNEEELLYIIELFNKYDADKSQTIDAKELRPLMKEFGVELNKKATTQLLKRTTGGKTAEVNLEDFLRMMTPYVRKKMGPQTTETDVNLNPFELLVMKREFSRADADGSGSIDVKELAAIIRKPPGEAKELFDKFHKGDGDLDFNEFVQIKVFLKNNR